MYESHVARFRVQSQLQATVGETFAGTWAGWEGVSAQVWHSSVTSVSREGGHVTTKGDGAAVETVGEGTDVCQGAGGEETAAAFGSTKEKVSEGASGRTPCTMKNEREKLFSLLWG